MLLDLNMWGLTGLQVIAALKADPAVSGIPVLMLTTNARDDERDACLALGAAGFFIKPRSIRDYGDLVAVIRACLAPSGVALHPAR